MFHLSLHDRVSFRRIQRTDDRTDGGTISRLTHSRRNWAQYDHKGTCGWLGWHHNPHIFHSHQSRSPARHLRVVIRMWIGLPHRGLPGIGWLCPFRCLILQTAPTRPLQQPPHSGVVLAYQVHWPIGEYGTLRPGTTIRPTPCWTLPAKPMNLPIFKAD